MDQETIRHAVEHHYGRGDILNSIMQALRDMGKDVTQLAPADLAPVDAFHIRGRDATVELATRAALKPGQRVLDVGSGLGGSARYLASTHHVQVTGIDVTAEYVDVARTLAELVGLQERVTFRQSSALALPFEAGAFDVVWTEHVQMNIADKQAFYAEMARVLVPRGRLVFHDIFQGQGGPLHFPVPWAEEPSISFLTTPEAVQHVLEAVGFRMLEWEDKSPQSLAWYRGVVETLQRSGAGRALRVCCAGGTGPARTMLLCAWAGGRPPRGPQLLLAETSGGWRGRPWGSGALLRGEGPRHLWARVTTAGLGARHRKDDGHGTPTRPLDDPGHDPDVPQPLPSGA